MEEFGGPHVSLDEYVRFVVTGTAVKGEYHCSECGYGVTVHRELPRCPMCGGEAWEESEWSPFTRRRTKTLL